MGKPAVKPKSQPLYDSLRDTGMKKKKAAKVANEFVVTKRGDTSASPKRKTSAKKTSKKKSSGKRSSRSKRR